MSYHNSGGVCLPSPTHVHHVDVSSCVRQFRRSLSRSPSKVGEATNSERSHCANIAQWNLKSPSQSPTPSSSPKRTVSNPNLLAASNPPHTPSPLAVPFPPSRLALRSSTRPKAAAIRSSSRTRTSPKSPVKRALSQTADTGNASQSSSASSSLSLGGQENRKSTSPGIKRKSFEFFPRMPYNLDVPGPVHQALSRLGGDIDNHSTGSTSSPLKRSDAIMNLDQASLGSPVAKRRSLHGSASFGHDFNVFDHGPTSIPQFEIHDDSNHEYELSSGSENNASVTSMPRRSSSLRKSTLQQRHGEKQTSWGRRHAAMLAQQFKENAANNSAPVPEASTSAKSKDRPRLSLDQFMPPTPRDSPFSNQGNLPNASMHMVNQPTHQPHPLSRTMTTSSSSSSIVDESPTPTHVPVNFGEKPRPKLDFSKSLPAGTSRPFHMDSTSEQSGSFATPNYKAAKPLPTAFMSTGLISKVNRNPEHINIPRETSKGNMPDTPCKKHANIFATYPANVPGSAIAKARHIRHSFGTPSTPFCGQSAAPGNFGKGSSVFGSAFGKLLRRGSILSVDGDEFGGSPEAKGDGINISDYEMPGTPTKQALPHFGSGHSHRGLAAAATHGGFRLSKRLPRTSSKLKLSATSGDGSQDDSDASMDLGDSPTTTNFRPTVGLSGSVSPCGRPKYSQETQLHSPTPLIPKSISFPFITTSRKAAFAKLSRVAPASPLERIEFFDKLPPQTPHDSMTPPDPSGLSISVHRESNIGNTGSCAAMGTPATPTAGRDYFSAINNRRLSTTPVSTIAAPEVDTALSSRFESIELIGSGEFSNVYKATKPAVAISTPFCFGQSPSRSRTPPTPMPERVFAVKKSRQPFTGIRDRQRKLQEVEVLKALRHSDHVVDFIDSWEDKGYLYIQTEYCEEGSLDVFLNNIGNMGRMDDFRIWKICLELCKGLRHIHDSGFIHLDLKPANILITFEGIIKIADFGMATSWPASAGIEGEGDREYIGPEILRGQYDKPSDIFALGLIMLEIAGNVVLPDNGDAWQRLRSGDFEGVPSLTWSEASSMRRDATGKLLGESDISLESYDSDNDFETEFGSPSMPIRTRNALGPHKSIFGSGKLFGHSRTGELETPPDFMRNMYHDDSLDNLVRWMTSPKTEERPTIHQVLQGPGLLWVEQRRRAGATIYEGNWGPADDILADDAEMMDV
ncbi:kinase-like protein [Calycina marina]|uniref:Kinase-like protein n=1 Tax=Calycina marina TaxID=1763456 RepID=A0A9P8CF70_9HELO|nr:kinase-like protein [Calycina marina]